MPEGVFLSTHPHFCSASRNQSRPPWVSTAGDSFQPLSQKPQPLGRGEKTAGERGPAFPQKRSGILCPFSPPNPPYQPVTSGLSAVSKDRRAGRSWLVTPGRVSSDRLTQEGPPRPDPRQQLLPQ